MEMQRKKRIGVGHVMRAAAVLGAALFLVWCDPIVSHAEAVGTVIPKSVNIREQPDQDSEVIGSATGGKEITIRGKVEKDGVTTWYQVYVSGETVGYVRADMVEQKGDGDIPTVTASGTAGESTAAADETAEPEGGETGAAASDGAQVQAQEEMAKQYGTVNVKAKVRPDPSTSNTPVDSIASGTQVVVSGKSEGSDGKTWYYVTFTGSNGSEKTGFIRSDLMELGDMLPVEEEPEEEPQEEQSEEPEPVPNNDYELKIETDSEGEEAWYIYDNVKGKKQKLVPLLESAYAQMLGDTEDTDAMVKQRIVIVALAVLLAVLVITVIIMAFKLRDAYYEDDDEDDDEEEEDEEEADRRPVRREREREIQERQPRRNTPDGEERKARRREEAQPAAGTKSDKPERKRRETAYAEKQDVKETARPAKRKAKNFLLDDDEFEFEFLNMDDKDLK